MMRRTCMRAAVSAARLACRASTHTNHSHPQVLRSLQRWRHAGHHLTSVSSTLVRPPNLLHGWQQRRPLLHSACRATLPFGAEDIQVDLGVKIEGTPKLSEAEVDQLAEQLYYDSKRVMQQAAMYLVRQQEEEEEEGRRPREQPPRPMELSLVLCDDAIIQDLNAEWRGVNEPTDVLSFEMGRDEDELTEMKEVEGSDLPVTVMGDIVLSLDTAARQAAERQHSLLDECRVLLVHGVLHLLGYDHEDNLEEEEEMAAAEAHILAALGWPGQGLITAASSSGGSQGSSAEQPVQPSTPAQPSPSRRRRQGTSEIRLLALDMDGTLLDSSSQVLPSSVEAIRAALGRGVTVMLATGKARPAAIKAMQTVGLAGEGLVVSTRSRGIFLQGLAVYGGGGALIGGGTLPPAVVQAAWRYAIENGVALCGFLGEECVTPAMTPEIQELHSRYYEPLAAVVPRVEDLLLGPAMRKLLFMAPAREVDSLLRPHWDAALMGSGAACMQAVPDMLEVVPAGVDKWVGMLQLLAHEGLPPSAVAAVGDGSNDLELVRNAGVGVAMGNAVPAVKAAAQLVVASNDDGGVAEAIQRLIL